MEKKPGVGLEKNGWDDKPNKRFIQNKKRWETERCGTGELIETGAAIAGLTATRQLLVHTALREVSHRMSVGCLLSDEQNEKQQLHQRASRASGRKKVSSARHPVSIAPGGIRNKQPLC